MIWQLLFSRLLKGLSELLEDSHVLVTQLGRGGGLPLAALCIPGCSHHLGLIAEANQLQAGRCPTHLIVTTDVVRLADVSQEVSQDWGGLLSALLL